MTGGGGNEWQNWRYFYMKFMDLMHSLMWTTYEFCKSFQVQSQEALCKDYTALKTSKTNKSHQKVGKSDIAIFRKNAPVAEVSKTESFPLTLFFQMTPCWWKVRKSRFQKKKLVLEDRTTLNPSTIDVMVDSPSKKQKPARYKLPFSGNLFLVRVVIYDKIERI